MSKKVFNVFSILCFALVLCFIGCTELINPKTVTDINLNIDLSKIIKSTRNTEEIQSSVSIGENPTIKVAIYDAKKYNATTNSTDNLDLITEAQAKIVNNEAKVKLNNIPVGIDAIVFAELSFSNGNSTEVMYAGNSEVFRVKPTDNKISLVLIKVEVDIEVDIEVKPDDPKPEEIINAKEPEIIIQPISCVKTTTESTTGGTTKTTLTCTAKSTDGGNLSFMWYKSEDSTNFEEFSSIVGPSLNGDGSYTSSTSEIEAQIGQRLYFYCVVTNTNENATGNKVASVRSNTVQVACIEGTLSSIIATYKSDSYELLGKNFNYNNVTVEETYKSGSDDNATTTITVIADESRYTISPTTDSKDAIGYVPYTVTYKDTTLPSNLTASLIVPVKYELDANNLVLETYFNSSSVSVSDTENKINIPQYGTVKYSYQISDNDKISFIDKNGDNTEIKDINNTGYYTATIVDEKNQDIPNGSICTSDGSYKYTVTLKSANEWFVCNSNTSKDFFVEVCPWKIVLTPLESTSTVDTNNISLGTYTLSISNDAYTSTSQNLPSATFSCLVNDKNIITNNELTIDEVFTTGTITASIGNIEVASLEISRIDTSTYEAFILRQRDTDGKEVTDVTGANIETSSTAATKVTVTNPDSSESVWTYFVKPENKSKFIENANYKVSVELKADKTTVVGIAAARADYFFTVNDTWTVCEFETGYLIGNENHQFTIGLGLSSEIEIRNLKIEKLETTDTTDTTEPSLVFDISKYAINSYLENNNRPGKIIEVSKDATNGSYNITINTPMCHSTGTDNSYIQDVKLHLRSYATENTGANRVSFIVDNLGANTFYTSVMADTASDKSTAWNYGTNPIVSEYFGSYEIDFPNYVQNDELNVDVITSSNEAITEPIKLQISEFAVGESDAPFANKIFAIQIDGVWTKIDDGAPISKEVKINAHESINFDVGLFNGFYDENETPSDLDDVTRFLYKGNTNITDNITYKEEEYDDSGNPKFKITNNSNEEEKTVEISLNENYEVVIEESTSTSGGGISLNEISSWEVLVTKINDDTTTTEFIIMNDLTATSTITVSKPVKIISDEEVTITRGNSSDGLNFEDSFFRVESAGNLELGSNENKIILDGGNANKSPILATAPLITSSGNLTLTNCTLQNNKNTSTTPGGAINISGGTFTMNGGIIGKEITESDGKQSWQFAATDSDFSNYAYAGGGGIYVASGDVTINGGKISHNYTRNPENDCLGKTPENTAHGGGISIEEGSLSLINSEVSYNSGYQGGGIRCYNDNTYNAGTLTLNKTLIKGNTSNPYSGSSFGGGLMVNNFNVIFAETTESTIEQNYSGDGGALFLENTTSTLKNITIQNNSYNPNGYHYGSELLLWANANVSIDDPNVNIASTETETRGIFINNNANTLKLFGDAKLDAPIYLTNGTTVTVAGYLSSNTPPVATITPENYEEGTQVLTADDIILLEQSVDKFALTSSSEGTDYVIDADGKLAKKVNTEQNLSTVLSGIDAIYDVKQLPSGVYYLEGDLILEAPVYISTGDVVIYAKEDASITGSFSNGCFFSVIDCSLTFGKDESTDATLTINAEKKSDASAVLNAGSGGTLNLKNNVICTGATNQSFITTANGTVNISGGKITENHGESPVINVTGGTVNITGGEISNNSCVNILEDCPAILVSSGTLNISGLTITISNNTYGISIDTLENQGASIYNEGGTVTILGNTLNHKTKFTQNIVNGKIEDMPSGGGNGTVYTLGDEYKDASGNLLGYVFEINEDENYIKIAYTKILPENDSEGGYKWSTTNVDSLLNISDGEEMLEAIKNINISEFPVFEALPDGWYLPTKLEFEQMYTNIDGTKYGGWDNGMFWTSTLKDNSNAYYFGEMVAGQIEDNFLSGDISDYNYLIPVKKIQF